LNPTEMGFVVITCNFNWSFTVCRTDEHRLIGEQSGLMQLHSLWLVP